MSLLVENLSRRFGPQHAVNNISFEVKKGEIVGFLGPNGAGKSTTLKIATTYLPPTAGRVVVGGYDVVASPMAVKKITGYLPEHNPLYLDLFVHEYLSFIGRLYGLRGSTLKARVAEMIALCGLSREQNKKIETLSKGYRQRVGIAQALIHDPSVLILDEPTSGLDPNQLVEIRKLIRDISVSKTVIFSTHIMQEVQALCERVVVINKGEIVANDRLANLLSKDPASSAVVAEFESPVLVNDIKDIEGVSEVTELGENRYRILVRGQRDIRPDIFRFAADRKLSLIGLKQEENSLESIFRQLTAPLPGAPGEK
ncbi:MAG TPA: gliding motility-associated ABC transporter ATP-binding subunit GldA [Chryseosolibacter sp.]|nr:gliding motility-associated ABC transporter ATP-binding subunit GldA [Chryseosolibacter sp.]